MEREPNYICIESREEAIRLLEESGERIVHYAFLSINFEKIEHLDRMLGECAFEDCLFLGCVTSVGLMHRMGEGCLIYPRIPDLDYNVFPRRLYTPEKLYAGYVPGQPETFATCYDTMVYDRYRFRGVMSSNVKITLARSLHDHFITKAMHTFLEGWDERCVVGVMGGHSLLRTDPMFRQIAHVSKRLTEEGTLMVTGGGPGAMEATHLGAWMAGRWMEQLDEAVDTLATAAPSYRDEGWLDSAFAIRERYPQERYVSLGVPTWLYGHEPSTPFATHIAKYFTNAIREDEILTIPMGGIIYTPGSAGTMQEIFQDAVQNHYLSLGYGSPMVFLGREFWTDEMPVYPLLTRLMETGRYKNLRLTLTDSSDEVIRTLRAFRSEKLEG
jgi:Predicted Rossmann fold nucleotide-binding protein